MGDGLDEHFADYVGDTTISDALVRWAATLNGTISPPLHPPRSRGSTAELFEVAFTEPASLNRPRASTRKLFVKVLPADVDSREPGRHHAALQDAGEFRRHLAGQPFPALPLPDGRQLMFQELVNGGATVDTLDELRGDDLVDAYRAVLRAILQEWNAAGFLQGHPGRPVEVTYLGAYVTRELEAVGALAEVQAVAGRFRPAANDRRRLSADGRPLPDPLRLFDPKSPYHAEPVSYCYGYSHGDLHGGNVLVPWSPSNSSLPDDFTLVDLSAYHKEAPLTRDLACLLLTTVLRFLPNLSEEDTEALAGYLVRPEQGRPTSLRGLVAEFVEIAHAEGATYSKPGWTSEWWMQNRLSLLSQALICTTYENLGPDRRRWCFRLAALVLAAIEEDRPPAGPDHVPPGLPVQLDPGPAGFPGDLDGLPGWAATTPPPGSQRGVGLVERPPPGRHRAPDDLIPEARPTPRLHLLNLRIGPLRQRAAAPATHGQPEPQRPADALSVPGRRAAIPRPRQPIDDAPPPAVGTVVRRDWPIWPRCLIVLMVLATLAGATFAVVRFRPDRHGQDDPPGTPSVGSALTPSWGPPLTDGDDHDESRDAGPELSALVQQMHSLDWQPSRGWYEYLCTRVWSPDPQGGPPRIDVYHDEQLWLSRRDGTVQRRVTSIDGSTRRPPENFHYAKGGYAARNPVPADDPNELRKQLRRTAEAGTGDSTGRADVPTASSRILTEVARMYRNHLLDLDQQRALLSELADTAELVYRDTQLAWASNRPGVTVSADDGTGLRKTLIFDLQDGRLLSFQTIRLGTVSDVEKVVGYESYLIASRTDRTDQQGCDDGRQQ